jgi:hypothetical protein
MSAFTQVAMVARMRRVDGHAHAGTQFLHAASNRFDDAGEFMSENEGRFEDGITDARIGEHMQIAAADTRGGNAQQNIAGTGIAGVGDAFHLNIARAVQPRRHDGAQR